MTWLLHGLSAAGRGAEPAGGGHGGENGWSRPEPGAGKGGFLWDAVMDWSLFPLFPPPAMPGSVPSTPRIAGCRRRCLSQRSQGASPRTTTAMVPTMTSTSPGAGSSSCLTRQVGCSWGYSQPPCTPPPLVLRHSRVPLPVTAGLLGPLGSCPMGLGWWKCISVAGAGGCTDPCC